MIISGLPYQAKPNNHKRINLRSGNRATYNLARRIFTIGLHINISGCVGVGAVAPSSIEHTNTNNEYYTRSIELTHDYKDNNRLVRHNYAVNKEIRHLSESEALRDWGAPDEITSNASNTTWTYRGQRLRWGGLVLHILITIPLAIPVGKEQFDLYFEHGQLVKLTHHTSRTSLLICDPAYMMMGAMASGMSSTGSNGSSSPGLCSLINREGLYFHYLTNY